VTQRARAFACALLLLGSDRAAAQAADAPAQAVDAPAQDAGPPAKDSTEELRERLAARDLELGSLRSEIERLKAKSATLASAPAVTAAPAPVPSATILPPAPIDPPASDAGARGAAPEPGASARRVTPLLQLRTSEPGFPAWQRELAAAVGALVLGFGLGWRTLDRRIRRKYGGLKIY